MAGYSGKPLIDKLGFKPGMTVHFKDAPKDYVSTLGEIPAGIFIAKKLNRPVDAIQAFYSKRSDLEADVILFQQYLELNGMAWICWPKKTSGVKSDLTEQTLRDVLLPVNLVDIKVAAIDDTWSGLKFVWRRR
jgi:hypothetical protein